MHICRKCHPLETYWREHSQIDRLLPMSYALSYRTRRRQDTNICHCLGQNVHGRIVVRKQKTLLGNTVTNDEAKSALGGTTANIQQIRQIALLSAGAISDMK